MWALIRDAVIDTGRVGFALIVGVLGTGRGVDRWGGGGAVLWWGEGSTRGN